MTRRTSKKQNTSIFQPKKVEHLTSSPSGYVRIIAGKWRGRKLPVKNIDGLRPTTDRVKETVFNWLAPHLYQAKCLDIFAGSGGLGLEALSRQAAQVTFVERNTSAAQQIKSNLNTLKAENAEVHQTDALTFLSQSTQSYDLVFIDPPFRQDYVNRIVKMVEDNQWLNDGALIYIETEKELGLPSTPNHWQLLKEKHAGQVSFRLYQREIK